MRATLPTAATVVLLSCATAQTTARTVAPVPAPSVAASATASQPGLLPDDRTRIAEAFRLADAVGDQIWPAWSSAPFAILLVTPEREFLLRHPRPSPDFTSIGYDSLLKTDVLVRPRQFAPNLLATFPAVGGVPTIVVGQPAATERKNSTEWVVTLLHEHFHQLQTSRPGYYARVDSLGLARGDKTGMWMLNYAFPYDSARVRTRFAALTQQLDSALATSGDADRATRWAAVRSARGTLRDALAPDDDRYLAFQMWQEGVARYTELAVARFAATRYTPRMAFAALPDFVPYATVAERIESNVRAGLRGSSLEHGNRVAFYPAGAAYALMLDRMAPGWRTHYFDRAMSLDAMLP
jgi:hypothetical protein